MNYDAINNRVLHAPPNTIRSFNDTISHLDNLLRLNIGEPDFPTPDKVKQAMIESVQADQSFYTHSRGLIELREAVSNYVSRHYNVNYQPEDEILITVGATEALAIATYGLLNPGDKVIVTDPSYVIYKTHLAIAGAEPIIVPVAETEFKLTPETLEQTLNEIGGAKAIILNFPSNPTGATYTRKEVEQLANVIREHDLIAVSDEIYAELTYTHKHTSLAEFIPERTLLINGTSKSHAMTGWRSAFLAGPAELINNLYPMHQSMVTAVATPVQYASIVAYNDCDDEIEAMRNEYASRREKLMADLDEIGFEYVYPEGAFYLFTKVPDWFDGDDVAFCRALAEEMRLAITPASVFGEHGQGYFRISYASSRESLSELVHRLNQFKQKYQ